MSVTPGVQVSVDAVLEVRGRAVPAEVMDSARARLRGLIGQAGIGGALVLPRCRQVHTFGMRFDIDVAFCASDGTVLRVIMLRPHRLSPVVWRSTFVVEAAAGAFARWPLREGDTVRVRESADHGE